MHTTSELSSILDKLANDNKFREHLLADPVAALAAIGITLSADQVPEERSLPSQEEIAADKDELMHSLETTATMLPFLLSGALVPA
ncbi:putative modified peptide [Duganella sp. CY15W]|uniref:NHLP-related RiPP peptide n=1 Tax=Duganella sp. CY15W TaxID=2692172 RepID=UPI00136A6E3F|nr:NHLP-related RiPP peptide [Duganella sp. CY15W]MYM31140.1 putative modified peptide [Duganella sp. CY15W]